MNDITVKHPVVQRISRNRRRRRKNVLTQYVTRKCHDNKNIEMKIRAKLIIIIGQCKT